MIYTVTFNPSLDYIITIKDFKIGKTNRTQREVLLPGGKGINVSTVLKHLGMETTALGFVAGFIGDEICKRVKELGVDSAFIRVENGCSRINVKMKEFEETEINGKGPQIDQASVDKLLKKLDSLKKGDVLVLAGSVPESMDKGIYKEILARLEGKEILSVVDATGMLLVDTFSYHPFLIKPNHHELGDIFGVKLRTRKEVIPYARKLQKMGARNVLVSMAGEGAVFVAETGQEYQLAAPVGKVMNAVGAGDSMVAGFLAGWLQTKDYRHAFQMGVAAGSASAFSELLATRGEIENLYRSIVVAPGGEDV